MTVLRLSLCAAALALAGAASHAQVAGGMSASDMAPSAATALPQVRIAPGATFLINFDTVGAPSVFSATSALAAVGTVKFDGSSVATKNGGAILNSGSNFGVTGFSAPNFLAFNCAATMSNGGKPDIPEIITFPRVVRNVSIRAGSGLSAGKNLKMFGIGPGGVQVREVVLAPAMQTVTFTKPLQRLLVSSETDACTFVLDDLKWST
jgi:hypothetical protein